MTELRHQPGAPYQLDDLLLRLPTPGGEPTSDEWATRLDRTLQQVRSLAGSADSQEHDEDLILRTPLPLESGEPAPTDLFNFDGERAHDDEAQEQGAIYDELRAPLKSGEHAPLRLTGGTRGEAPHVDATKPEVVPHRPESAQKWLYILTSSVGVLAAAAAIVLMVRDREPIQVGQVAVPASVAKEQAPTSGSNLTVAATPQSPQEAVAKAEALPDLSRKAAALPARSGAVPTHATLTREKPAQVAMREEVPAPSEPPLTPAAGPSNLPDHPSLGALNAALSSALPVAQRCLVPAAPVAGVRITFQSDGTVQRVQPTTANLDAATSSCLQQAFGKARVAPFARAQFEVNRTISRPAN